jgi:hypothetical protein
MASTYSPNLALELIGTGDQSGTWGTTTNTNLGTLIEQAIAGYGTTTVSGSTTLTIPNGASGTGRNMVIAVTSGTGGTLYVPDANTKLYIIFNGASGTVTVQRVSGGASVAVPAGKNAALYCTGANVYEISNTLSSLTLASPLSVASGGTGLATLTANNVILGNGTSTPSFVAPGTSGNLLTSNGTTWASSAFPTSFTGTFSGTATLSNGSTISDGATAFSIGYLNVPQNAQSSNYTFVLADNGKHIYSTNSGSQTLTIPANASVAFPTGAVLTLVNNGTTSITIGAGSVTLYQAGTGSTGNRTLATKGLATLLKVATDTWFISGSGVS